MFERVEIAGYRGLESFSMTQLGRVNLIVGANSSGKTSVLEAIGFLASEGALIEIWRSLHRRLETFDDNEVDVRHLFSGHTLGVAPIDAGAIGVRINGNRIPLGSLGDGAWRILGIALALVQSPHGVLLVDEIDTGLHHTVMEKMWHLVYETAKRLDVQVFATTHSWDCVEALASIARGDGHDITMQRIERGKSTAIAYDEPMIRAAASRRRILPDSRCISPSRHDTSSLPRPRRSSTGFGDCSRATETAASAA